MEIFVKKSSTFYLCNRFRLPGINILRLNQQNHPSINANNDQPEKLSTLFVPKRFAGIVYQIVKPCLDVQCIENNFQEIERSCRSRNISLNLQNAIPLLKEWEDIKIKYSNIQVKEKEFVEEKKRCESLKLTDELENLIQKHDAFVENTLKAQRKKLFDMEDIVFPIFQVIPNTLSNLTYDEDVVEKSFGTPTTNGNLASHVEVGKSMGMLEFSDVSPSAYYLMGKFADLEMCIQDYFFNNMQDLGFSPMSCTDFCKSFIIEAIGLDPDSVDDCIPIQSKDKKKTKQKLNLVGGGSFASFCAYLTNMNVSKSSLPLSYFSLGRCYLAKHRNVSSPDLFSVVQTSNIQLVVLTDEESDSKFDELFQKLESIYAAFGIPFRTVNVGAVNLNVTEKRKKQIELWSPSRQNFIPVSWLSSRGDFLSQRLNISYGEDYNAEGFCYIMEGVAVNVPVLIGCIVENLQNSNNAFDLPKVFSC